MVPNCPLNLLLLHTVICGDLVSLFNQVEGPESGNICHQTAEKPRKHIQSFILYFSMRLVCHAFIEVLNLVQISPCSPR